MVYLEQVLPPLFIKTALSLSPHSIGEPCRSALDVKTKRPQPVMPFVILSQCGNSNKLALQQANFVPCDRLLQKAY